MGKTRRGTNKKAHVRTLYPALERLASTTAREAAKKPATTQANTQYPFPASAEAEGSKESYPSVEVKLDHNGRKIERQESTKS